MNFHLVAIFSSVPHMLESADAVLALAKEQPEKTQVLSACAIIITAAALDQGIKAALLWAAKECAFIQNFKTPDIEFAVTLRKPFRERLSKLPELLTDGELCLNPHSQQCKVLYELISLRNALMHIDEPPKVFTNFDSRISFDLKKGAVKLDLTDLVDELTTRNPWLSVTLEQASAYRSAADVYIQEVLFPSNGQIRPGEIVMLVSGLNK